MNKSRYQKVKAWMKYRNIPLRSLGEQLGFGISYSRELLLKERISTENHKKFLDLGFPVELLPTPLDVPRGRRPQVPHFPGLDKDNHNKKEESSNV